MSGYQPSNFEKLEEIGLFSIKEDNSKLKKYIFKESFMKKNVLSAVFLFVFLGFAVVNAQITLLHTFENCGYFKEYLDSDIGDFRGFTVGNKVYNTDFSLRASVDITPPDGYSLNRIEFVSEKIFNSNNNLEFLVVFYKSSNEYALQLYDETGNMLKDFGKASYYYTINVSIMPNGEYRLTVTTSNLCEIYSLPGKKDMAGTPIVKKATELAYKLRPGETATMKIYNAKGQLIETKQIDYVFDRILLNTTKYSRGAYVYEINGVAKKFLVR